MKKILSFIIVLAMMLSFAACQKSESDSSRVGSVGFNLDENTTESAITLKIAGLKGPTSMGMVKLMDDCAKENSTVSAIFTLHGSADELTPKLLTGEIDIAAVPANLASVLYQKSSGKIRLIAVNTLGVLYIVTKGESVSTIADLKGKTIYATGKGSTPEYNLRYILTQNGIDPDKDVNIEFKSEPTEVVSIMAQNETAVAMLPQPYVTVAQSKIDTLQIALSLNDEWDKVGEGSTMVTGVLVARADVIKNNPQAVYNFLTEYEQSVNWVKENNSNAAVLCADYGIVASATIAEKALPQCNICYYDADDASDMVNQYLNILFTQNPASVGGKLPDEFFFVKKDGLGK